MRICEVEDCNRKHHAKKYCKKHYMEMFKRGRRKERTTHDPNKIIIKGTTAEIILYDKHCKERARTIIDFEDVEKVKKHKWRIVKGYVVTHLEGKSVGIQNFLMGFRPTANNFIDHADRNTLNNRRYNFRTCTKAENCWNRGRLKNNTSGFKGVVRTGKKWGAQISRGGNHFWLGTFKNKIKAAEVYNKAAIKLFGRFAYLNEF